MAAPAVETTRSQAFDSFYTDKAKRKRYSPEFIDSLVQTMRIPDGLICRDEQVWAWVRWRTWGNSSETAMSSWHSSGWELDQVDCALDLHWFQSGRPLEEIENSTRAERKQARDIPAVRKRRSSISRALLKVEARGHVDLSRGKIYALTSPTFSPQVVEKLEMLSAAREQISKNPRFVHFLTLSGARELLDAAERARNDYREARQLLRPWEKAFQAAERRGGPILIPEKECKEIHGGGESEEYVHLEEPPPPEFSSEDQTEENEYLPLPPETPPGEEIQRPPEELITECLVHYLTRMHPGTDQQYPDSTILSDIRRVMQSARKTTEDLWQLFDTRFRRGSKARGYAWFRKIVQDEWGGIAHACTNTE